MNAGLSGRAALILLAPLCLLLLAFFLLPLGSILWTSLHDQAGFTLKGYEGLISSTLFARVLQITFNISLSSTLISLLIGYPIALHLVRQPPRRRAFYMVLLMLPFWTSILVKSYAFIIILGQDGFINDILGWVSGGHWRLEMIFNRTGVIVGMINYLIPFMVLPILASLLALDPALPKAAEIMGAGPLRIFLRVTLPLSLPGVLAGILMNMTLSIGSFITPALLGGRRDLMMANLVDFYTRQTLDWNLASSIAVVLLALSGLLVFGLMRVRQDEHAI
jgi:mannopine transport system permease protein